MHKIILAIVVWWIVAIMWGKLLLASDYQYNKYTWGVFLDSSFPQAQAEYDRKVASGEYIRLVDYSSNGIITVIKEINKQVDKKPTKTSQKNATYNIDKLAECVAVAETSWCTKWMWRTKIIVSELWYDLMGKEQEKDTQQNKNLLSISKLYGINHIERIQTGNLLISGLVEIIQKDG